MNPSGDQNASPKPVQRPEGCNKAVWSTKVDIGPSSTKALELSLREALSLKHSYIGTEHLLLAILRLGKGEAYELLRDRVDDPASLRPKVMEALRQAS